MSNIKRLSINRYALYQFLITVLLVIITFALLTVDSDVEKNLKVVSILGIILFLICINFWKKISGTLFSLYIFFLGSFYLFNMGQSLLYLFNIDFQGYDTYVWLNHFEILNAQLYTLICISLLNMGALLSASSNIAKKNIESDEKTIRSMKIAGLLMFFVTFIPFMITLVKLWIDSRTLGYAGAFESIAGRSSWNKIVDLLGEFCLPSLFMIYISFKRNKSIKIISGGMLIIFAIIYLVIGDRTLPASVVLGFFWLRSNLKLGNSKVKMPFGLLISSLFFAVIIPSIGTLRNTSKITFSNLINNILVNNSLVEGITDTIATLGYSIFPLVKTMDIIPISKGYSYGNTYFFALLSIFPNLFGGVHISVKKAGLAKWLMDYLDMGYGPGYSFTAEAWYNFGWLGVLCMLVIGYMYGKFLYGNTSDLGKFITVVFFVLTITSPRRDMLTVVRSVTYYIGLPVVLIYVINNIKRRLS